MMSMKIGLHISLVHVRHDPVFDPLVVAVPGCAILLSAGCGVPSLPMNQQHQHVEGVEVRDQRCKACKISEENKMIYNLYILTRIFKSFQ